MKATHRIINIYYLDAYYEDKKDLIGKEGIATKIRHRKCGYSSCHFDFTEPCEVKNAENGAVFYGVKLEEL